MSAKMLQFSVIVSFASALLSLTMGQQHLDDSIDANSCRNASFSAAVQVNDEYIVFFDNLYSRFRWNFHSNAPQVLEGFPRQIVGTNHWNWFQEKTSADGIIGAFSPAPDLVVIVKQPGPRMFEFRLVAFSIQFIREITEIKLPRNLVSMVLLETNNEQVLIGWQRNDTDSVRTTAYFNSLGDTIVIDKIMETDFPQAVAMKQTYDQFEGFMVSNDKIANRITIKKDVSGGLEDLQVDTVSGFSAELFKGCDSSGQSVNTLSKWPSLGDKLRYYLKSLRKMIRLF